MAYEVQGERATLNEYNVAMALDSLKIGYIFQYAIDGGKRVRGGMVIDFVIQEPPKPTPLNVDGDYWHKGEREVEDRLQELSLASKAWLAPLVRVMGNETNTFEDALVAVKRVLRL